MALPAYQVPEPATHVSPEDYLRLESESEYKHEYLNGRVVAMAGASFAHNRICTNVIVNLGSQLRGSTCTPLGSDQRVHVKNRASFLYPDVSVVCGKPEFLEIGLTQRGYLKAKIDESHGTALRPVSTQ